MKKVRVIARLDVKGPNVIKGIQFECLRVMGKPGPMAEKYYSQGADEIIYIDIVASLYQRDNLLNIVNQASENIFVPITVGGGIRELEDIKMLLAAGADKVAINTTATKNPGLIEEASRTFGSQCIVGSIEAKKTSDDSWEAYTDNGRQSTGLDVLEWARELEKLGSGEILLTSVDLDGTKKGLDLELIKRVSDAVSIPVVASGGASDAKDISTSFKESKVDGIAIGSILHYQQFGVSEIKEVLVNDGVTTRVTSDSTKLDVSLSGAYDIVDYNKYTVRHLEQGDFLEKEGKLESKQEDDSRVKGEADIGIINYRLNNVKSVAKAFEKIGKSTKILETFKDFVSVKALILPGVGAFEQGMKSLTEMGLVDPIKKKIREGLPLLGICLGMQLLFFESEEFGIHKGLGLLEGRVVPLKRLSSVSGPKYRLPHMGWNEIKITKDKNTEKDKTILKNLSYGNSVYFAHSYYSVPKDPDIILANCNYGEQEFCVAVKSGSISAVQFHPEKSGNIGIAILEAFCQENGI